MSGELVALNQNWLDATTDPNTGGIKASAGYSVNSTLATGSAISGGATFGGLTATSTYCGDTIHYNGYCWPPYGHSWLTITTEHKPIRLGYSEVERLRAAAKRDAKLKKILAKFTDQIEVIVDFE